MKSATSQTHLSLLGWLLASLVLLSGCSEVAARSPLHNFKVRAKQVRNEVKVMRPGELGPLLERVQDEKLRYVVYRSLEAQRSRLRGGRDTWTELDIVSLVETSRRDMNAEYQPLRAVAKGHHLWAQLEGMEAGQIARMMEGSDSGAVVSWVTDFKRQGRPLIEGRLNRHDISALQRYAMKGLPDTRSLLRYTFEQDQRPGQVAGFLGRNWSEDQLAEIMRMWCNAEGWSPLAHTGDLSARERHAVKVALGKLERSNDPLTRREAQRWGQWFSTRVAKFATLR